MPMSIISMTKRSVDGQDQLCVGMERSEGTQLRVEWFVVLCLILISKVTPRKRWDFLSGFSFVFDSYLQCGTSKMMLFLICRKCIILAKLH